MCRPDIYLDMPAKTYFADPCHRPSLSQSIAKVLIERSPAHARLAHPRLNPDYVWDEGDYDKRKAIGDAVHKYLLERGKDVAELGYDDFRTKAAREARDECRARGEVPVLEKHMDQVRQLVESVKPRLHLPAGDAEVVLIWEENGMWFRSMVDWISPDGTVFDIKTTGRSIAPHNIPAIMDNDGWHVQAAFIERGLLKLAAPHKWRFRFIAIEQDPPFEITINEIGPGALELGRRKVNWAVDIWRECVRHDRWPGYPPGVHTVELPGWSEQRWLDREVASEVRRTETFNPNILMAG